MLKTLKVPPELIALSQLQRAATREIGAPLYLPAFENHLLGEPVHRSEPLDREGDFAIVTIGGDEDDDFY